MERKNSKKGVEKGQEEPTSEKTLKQFNNNSIANHTKKSTQTKVPKWKIRQELERQLHILTRERWIIRSIIMTMLEIGCKKGGFLKNPIIKAKTTYNEGKHSPSTTFETFRILREHEPRLLDPVEDIPYDIEDGEARFNKNTYDRFSFEIGIYDQLDNNGLLNNSERREIQVFNQLLNEFYGIEKAIL